MHKYGKFFDINKAKLSEEMSKEMEKLQRGEITTLEFWHKVCSDLDMECPPDDILRNIFPREYSRAIQVDGQMVELIKKLGQNYKLGVISNTIEDHEDVFKGFGILEFFDTVILSNEVDLVKPQPEIYELALGRLGVEAEECIFIDDMLSNVHGAKKVGMEAILFEGCNNLKENLDKKGIKF